MPASAAPFMFDRAAGEQRAVLEVPAAVVDPEHVRACRRWPRTRRVARPRRSRRSTTPSPCRSRRRARWHAAHVGEGPVALVAVQRVQRRRVVVLRASSSRSRPSVDRQVDLDLGRPVDVVRDEQVEVAVAVVVEEGAAPVPQPGPRDAGARGHVREASRRPRCAAARWRDVGHVQVHVAVAVVVAGGDAHAVAAVADAARSVTSSEARRPSAARCVAVQAVASSARSGAGLDVAALHAVDVQPAVAVVVEERQTAGRDLRHPVALGVEVDVAEVEPGGGGDLDEPGGAGRRAARRRRAGAGLAGAVAAAGEQQREQAAGCEARGAHRGAPGARPSSWASLGRSGWSGCTWRARWKASSASSRRPRRFRHQDRRVCDVIWPGSMRTAVP